MSRTSFYIVLCAFFLSLCPLHAGSKKPATQRPAVATTRCHQIIVSPALEEDTEDIQNAFFGRLHYLGSHHSPTPQEILRQRLLQAQTHRLLDWGALPFIRIGAVPELKQLTQHARESFRRYQHRTVANHIDGAFVDEMHPELRVPTLRMDTGGHLLLSWDELLRETFRALPLAALARLNARVEAIDPLTLEDILDTWEQRGLNSRDIEWKRFLLPEAQEITVNYHEPDASQSILLPRHLFTRYGWNRSVTAARLGACPIGGKTVFPISWSKQKIRDAVLSVLADPEARVVRRSAERTLLHSADGQLQNNQTPSFYLRSRFSGVIIDVGITGTRVGTAFPAWNQRSPKNIRQVYLQWHVALKKMEAMQEEIHDLVMRELEDEGTLKSRVWEPLPLSEMIELHLGFIDHVSRRNPNVAVDRWIRYLDPSINYFQGLEGRRAKISSFLMLDRLVTELEALSW